jgi:hypothetical protein
MSHSVDAELKAHAIFITSIESAIAVAGGSKQLASRRDLLQLMTTAIREGFKGLQACGIPSRPFKLKLMFLWRPKWFPVSYWRRALQSKLGEYSLGAHASAAPAEIRQLIDEIRALIRETSVSTPAMNKLYGALGSSG